MKRSAKYYRYCNPLVKQHAMGSHNKCNLTKNASMVDGEVLNDFFTTDQFDTDSEYQVCCNMRDKLKKHLAKRKHNETEDDTASSGINNNESTERAEAVGAVEDNNNDESAVKKPRRSKFQKLLDDLHEEKKHYYIQGRCN